MARPRGLGQTLINTLPPTVSNCEAPTQNPSFETSAGDPSDAGMGPLPPKEPPIPSCLISNGYEIINKKSHQKVNKRHDNTNCILRLGCPPVTNHKRALLLMKQHNPSLYPMPLKKTITIQFTPPLRHPRRQ